MHTSINKQKANTDGSVAKAIDILRLLADENTPLGLTSISRRLRHNPSTCLNILRILVDKELLQFEPGTKHYSLDENVLHLVRPFMYRHDPFTLIRPYLEKLAMKHQVTSALWELSGERFVLLGHIESGADMRIGLKPRQRVPMLAGAIGRCVAAYTEMPRDKLKNLFDKVKWQQPPGFAAFLQEVNSVRQQGWAIDRGQLIRGMTAVSAPVVDHHQRIQLCIASVSLYGQLQETQLQRLGRATRKVARIATDMLYQQNQS